MIEWKKTIDELPKINKEIIIDIEQFFEDDISTYRSIGIFYKEYKNIGFEGAEEKFYNCFVVGNGSIKVASKMDKEEILEEGLEKYVNENEFVFYGLSSGGDMYSKVKNWDYVNEPKDNK